MKINKLGVLTIISSLGSIFVILGLILKINPIFQLVFLSLGIILTIIGLIGLTKHILNS